MVERDSNNIRFEVVPKQKEKKCFKENYISPFLLAYPLSKQEIEIDPSICCLRGSSAGEDKHPAFDEALFRLDFSSTLLGELCSFA